MLCLIPPLLSAMVDCATQSHSRLWRNFLRKYGAKCARIVGNEIMSIAARLDRLHLLFDYIRGVAIDSLDYESHIRLDDIQECRLFAVAGK